MNIHDILFQPIDSLLLSLRDDDIIRLYEESEQYFLDSTYSSRTDDDLVQYCLDFISQVVTGANNDTSTTLPSTEEYLKKCIESNTTPSDQEMVAQCLRESTLRIILLTLHHNK